MSFSDFSSWPRDQEQSFVVYEQRQSESKKKAMMIGGGAGLAWLVLMVGVFMGVAPEHKDMTKGMNMGNLSKKKKVVEPKAETPAPAPAPAAAPAAAPAEAKPAEAAPAEEKK
jgi:hypothetical protein